jgi:Glyoxalase-like domain
MAGKVQVVFDCKDPESLSRFYADALHYKMQDPPEGYASWKDALKASGVPEEEWNSASAIVDPEGSGPRIYFQLMETPKLGKNRLHIDVNASDKRASEVERKKQVRSEVERIAKLGAIKQEEWDDRTGFWIVMLDPEGNEFCVQ